MPGATALPTDLLRPYPGYGGIRMWDYSGYSNYHALQTGVNRRFENGFMFSASTCGARRSASTTTTSRAGLPDT